MKILITGGCGFLGSNLAARALAQGNELAVFDNLSRLGSAKNLGWLRSQGKFRFFHGDIRNPGDVRHAIRAFAPDCLFHLAGQVAMTTSIDDPRKDFEINALGTLNVLEAVRELVPNAPVIYSSTNKVYGDLEQYTYVETDTRYQCLDKPDGFDETTPLHFHSPYGCSKGAADQYMLDYARMFGLKTVVFRHSSIYGCRQFATHDQGWIGWFCQKALETKRGTLREPFTISGTGKQVRDVLHAEDMTSIYYAAIDHIEGAQGMAFNIGGGVENSLSLLELFAILEDLTGIRLMYNHLPPRQSDQRVFVANIGRAGKVLGWAPKISARNGIVRMLAWVEDVESMQV